MLIRFVSSAQKHLNGLGNYGGADRGRALMTLHIDDYFIVFIILCLKMRTGLNYSIGYDGEHI